MNLPLLPVIGVLSFLAGLGGMAVVWRLVSPRSRKLSSTHQGIIDGIRDTGDLIALEAHYKDVGVHRTEGGYLVSEKKMLVICSFEMQFRFDLRKARLENRDGGAVLVLPPCQIKTLYKDIEFYDEQDGRVLHYIPLVRDLMPSSKFTLEQRNEFIAKAKENAKEAARKSDEALLSKAEYNAEKTLQQLFRVLRVQDDITVQVASAGSATREEEDQIPASNEA